MGLKVVNCHHLSVPKFRGNGDLTWSIVFTIFYEQRAISSVREEILNSLDTSTLTVMTGHSNSNYLVHVINWNSCMKYSTVRGFWTVRLWVTVTTGWSHQVGQIVEITTLKLVSPSHQLDKSLNRNRLTLAAWQRLFVVGTYPSHCMWRSLTTMTKLCEHLQFT